MADYLTRTRTKVLHEYYLDSPTNATEFQKAMSAAVQEMEATGRRYFDNSITVESRDDEVVIYWEEDHNAED